MGFYAPSQLLRDLREHEGEILPIDVNHSYWDVTLEQRSQETRGQRKPLRLGFRLIIGFSERHAQTIEDARDPGPFLSLDDFTQRTKLNRAVIKQLSDADTFRSVGHNRRSALWHTLAQDKTVRDTPLFDDLTEEADDSDLQLPEVQPIDEVFRDYAATGLSLKAHPISFYREQLDELGTVANERLASFRTGRRVRVAGLVIMRQRPSTAKGITFVTIEDETGVANLVVHQKTWNRFYAVARHGTAWLAHGRVENKHTVIHVVVDRLELLADNLKALHAPSRDFR
jgi:error-prone DNA polymerase